MNYIFDTTAFVAFFSNEKGAEKIAKLFAKIEEKKAEGYISPITLTELYYLYAKKDVSLANERIEAILLSRLKLVKIDAELTLRAEKYKNLQVPLANALVAAASKEYEAMIVGHDSGFEKMDVELLDYETE